MSDIGPRLFIAFGWVSVAGALFIAAIPFAEDKATEHAQFHAATALVAALLASGVARFWVPTSGWRRNARLLLVGALWLAAGTSVLDSAGAFGFEGDDETVRVDVLWAVHGLASGLWFAALLLVVLGLLLTLVSLVAGPGKRT